MCRAALTTQRRELARDNQLRHRAHDCAHRVLTAIDELDFEQRQALLRLVVEEVKVTGWNVRTYYASRSPKQPKVQRRTMPANPRRSARAMGSVRSGIVDWPAQLMPSPQKQGERDDREPEPEIFDRDVPRDTNPRRGVRTVGDDRRASLSEPTINGHLERQRDRRGGPIPALAQQAGAQHSALKRHDGERGGDRGERVLRHGRHRRRLCGGAGEPAARPAPHR